MKDCGCITHEGPHWLHIDYIDHAHNLKLLERALGYAQCGMFHSCSQTLAKCAEKELERLNEKERSITNECVTAWRKEHPEARLLPFQEEIDVMRRGNKYPYALLGPGAKEDIDEKEAELWRDLAVAVAVVDEWPEGCLAMDFVRQQLQLRQDKDGRLVDFLYVMHSEKWNKPDEK